MLYKHVPREEREGEEEGVEGVREGAKSSRKKGVGEGVSKTCDFASSKSSI